MIRALLRKLGSFIVGKMSEEDDDFEGQPWPPVTLSKSAKDMLVHAPEPSEPFKEEPPLAGSVKARILRARER